MRKDLGTISEYVKRGEDTQQLSMCDLGLDLGSTKKITGEVHDLNKCLDWG